MIDNSNNNKKQIMNSKNEEKKEGQIINTNLDSAQVNDYKRNKEGQNSNLAKINDKKGNEVDNDIQKSNSLRDNSLEEEEVDI